MAMVKVLQSIIFRRLLNFRSVRIFKRDSIFVKWGQKNSVQRFMVIEEKKLDAEMMGKEPKRRRF